MSLVQIQVPKPHRGKTQQKHWRSLDQLAGNPEFEQFVEREFPSTAADMLDGASRRSILKVMAASFGLAGLTACSRPELRFAPQARLQEDYVPGSPYNYTSAISFNGDAAGIIVETYDGRPVKIEGNPDHPDSQGGATALAQASLLDLYDPDRAKSVLQGTEASSWEAFEGAVRGLNLGDGAGLRVLSETVNSPTLADLRSQLLARYPNARWVEFDSISRENERAGTQIAFGAPMRVKPQFDRAKVILSLDYDFLGNDSVTPMETKAFSKRRRIESEEDVDRLSRLYVVESQFSLTGANAEHRLRQKGAEIRQFAQDLLAALGGAASAGEGRRAAFLNALAADLRAAGAEAIVVAGPRQSAIVHALVAQINQTIGSTAVAYAPAPLPTGVTSGVEALRALTGEINAGQVSTLLVLGGNPTYSAPADLQFSAAMAKPAASIYLGPEVNETAAAAKWTLPEAHYLEAWGDARGASGAAAIQQPMIEPLFGGKSAIEVLAIVLNLPTRAGYDLVKNYWTRQFGANAENTWKKALNDGVVAPAAVPGGASLNAGAITAALATAAPAASGIEVAFVPSAIAWDGRFANNAWMQETPEPMTKLVWDNAILVSPRTAEGASLKDGDIVKLSRGNQSVEGPVMIQPGQADDSVTVSLGYGRGKTGGIGTGIGFNAGTLRTADAFWYGQGFAMAKTGSTHEFVTTQQYGSMDEPADLGGHHRPLVRELPVAEYKAEPHLMKEMVEVPELETLHTGSPVDYSKGYQWGMAIDLNSCTGCSACVVACQAENNTPVVGKDQVNRGREMHWLRIDRYYVGEAEEPRAVAQPIPCMQCENAPCEYVCPVAATTHSAEGLNDMAYNRCVGTRYCANNCPYKVRHFNFLNYHKEMPELWHMVQNPEVSVRMRGIMEKCTYCVQRIQNARITAKTDGRRQIREEEVQTACQQTCPADAIAFGNINDPNSRVAKLKRQERNYSLLEELNVKPRTTYLGRIRNVNPALETETQA